VPARRACEAAEAGQMRLHRYGPGRTLWLRSDSPRSGERYDYLADATVRRTAMTGIDLFHVGVLVKDLDETVSRFSDLLQLSFEPPRTMEVVVDEGAGARARTIRVSYSLEGPPCLELIECQDDGLWGYQHGVGLHHVGAWDGYLPQRLRNLAQVGAVGRRWRSVTTCGSEVLARSPLAAWGRIDFDIKVA
jgi:Glyoxalase/Bleomycin resistance protein/Dioxygenase superfamily